MPVNPDILEFSVKIQEKDTTLKGTPYENNPYFVLDRIHNRSERQNIIKSLISIGYDFQSGFPYEKLLDKHPVLNIVRKNLIREQEYYSFYVKKGKKGNTAENLNFLIVRTRCNLSKFAFRTGFDIFMNYEKSGACVIIVNPKYKRDYSLSSIYIKLNRSEKDNWKLWKGDSVLRAEKTEIPREEIEKYLKEYILAK